MKSNWQKNAMVFLAAQAVSLFGSSLVQYAIIWHINLTTGSGVYLTFATLCGYVPALLLSPFAGVWADRYNRKTLIMLSDGAIALATLILALVVQSGNQSLMPLFVALVIRSFGSAVQTPSVSAILPAVVPEEHLMKVNGINGSIQSFINVLSPAFAAVLLKTLPFSTIFYIDVLTAAIGISLTALFFRYRHVKPEQGQKNDYLGEVKLGFQYIGAREHIKILFTSIFFINFLCVPGAFLSALHVIRTFGDDAFFLMGLEVTFSVGMIFGGVLIALWGGFRNRVKTMLLTGLVMSFSAFGLGVSKQFWLFLVVNFIYGVALPCYNTPAMVFLQENIDEAYRGRVFSVLNMISSFALPLGTLLFGPMGDVFSIASIMAVSGILMAVSTAILLTRPALMREGEPKSIE